MALEVNSKDCTALSDSELEEFANLCTDGPARFDVGLLSKQRDEWVLVGEVRDGNQLVAFSFMTLERIGGTPAALVGLASVVRDDRQRDALESLIWEVQRRSWLAFPDEDVLLGTRLINAAGFAVFDSLVDIVPRPSYRPTGEERAWARRLAKRFGFERRVDDRTFVIEGDGSVPGVFDFDDGSGSRSQWAPFFEGLDFDRGDSLVAFGWAVAEQLAEIGSPSRKMI